MDVNQISGISNQYTNVSGTTAKTSKTTQTTDADTSSDTTSTSGVVYDRASLIQQMKNDTDTRTQQLTDMVKNSLSTQLGLSVNDDEVWSFLASGNFTVSSEVKQSATEAISEDGYWGVDRTSDRILEFAKALSGGDTSKADTLLDAFKKGYEQATGTWGKELPSLCQDTYDAVVEKFQDWVDGTEE